MTITRRAFLANGSAAVLAVLVARKPRPPRTAAGTGFGLAPFGTSPFGG